MYPERKKGISLSIALHFFFLLFILLDLSSLFTPPPPEEPAAITVEILPISAISNVKPSEPAPVKDDKPDSKKEEPKKPSPPVKTADKTPPPPPPPPKPVPKPPEKPKETPPEKPKDPPKKTAKPEDLEAVLAAVRDTAKKEKSDEDKKKKDAGNPNKSVSTHYDASQPMTMTEKDAIMSQFIPCWNVPAGAKNAQDLVVVMNAEYNDDGSLIKVSLSTRSLGRYDTDSFFRAAADAALRAVKRCSPLKNLDKTKYDTWHFMELEFDPKFMLN